MKKGKLIFGLALSLGLLLSFGTFQKSVTTNIGWGISKLCEADNNTTSDNATNAAAAGAAIVAGAQDGAEIGSLGGPVGILAGAAVGAL